MIIKTVRLYEIDDIEFVTLAFFCITNSEIKPLRKLVVSAMVKFQFQIVFKIRYLSSPMQISRFKARLEDQRRILSCLRSIEMRQLFIIF